MKRLNILALCLIAGICFAEDNPQKYSHENAVADIRQVVEIFRTSIINKDTQSFGKIFYDKNIPWLGVLDDASLKRVVARNPKKSKVDIYDANNYTSFIEGLAKAKPRFEEKFDHLNIETDGDIASVHFDYSFNIDDYKSNWGKEAWHLVRTETGWKIASVIYSVTLNPTPPAKPKTP